MSKISNYIEALKKKRAELVELQKDEQMKRMNCDVKQFYEDGLKLSNVNDGMVIIIRDNEEIRRMASKGFSHRKVAQEIFDELDVQHIDFSEVDRDFGELIPEMYNSVFIRMASGLNGCTIVYYPEVCTRFQFDKIHEFNDEVKNFNAEHGDDYHILFEYNGKGDVQAWNLDGLEDRIRDKVVDKREKLDK
ncbi:MAG: hypothetical protein IJI22_02650 [Bacilli bacterium]|nr:hypothetical protein [Bacilli bacterium]